MLVDLFYYIFLGYIILMVLAIFYKRFITIYGFFWVSFIFIGSLFASLLTSFNNYVYLQKITTLELSIVQLDWCNLEVAFHIKIDMLGYFFLLLVCCIGFFTNIYTLNYFKYEAEETTFFLYLNWFIISMLIFVLAENGFTLFLGWELIGLTSFLLINFWVERRGVLKAAFKAFSFNKLSDALLLTFLVILWNTVGHTQFILLEKEFANSLDLNNLLLYFAVLGLIICAGIKSAQLLAHVWLPDSMEAPVPASALIHSATLVSAGVYLLLRFSFLLDYFDLHNVVLIWGSTTALYGGIVAASQTDVKKLLAYSTISHCGFLFVCVGLQWVWLTVAYLYLHGLFKAATFFCVGSFIRISQSQDSRKMGFISRLAPIEMLLLLICAMNLGGLPFSLGYFYKKFFLAVCFQFVTSYWVLFCAMGGMLTSLVYIYRLVYYTSFDYNKCAVNNLVKSLQNHKSYHINRWSYTTILHVIAVVGILISTIIIYHLLLTVFITLDISFEQGGLLWKSSSFIIKSSETLYDGYYIIFYSVYLIIACCIIFVDNRQSYTTYYKWEFMAMLVGCLILFFYIVQVKYGLSVLWNYFIDYFNIKL